MTKREKNERKRSEKQVGANDNWLTMRGGLRVITFLSLGMAILTAWRSIPANGWLEGIFWGVVFGGSIWLVFFGFLKFNQWFRR